MKKQTLYGLDKKDGVKVWSIWTEKDRLFIEHGLEGGKLQIKEEVIKGKNIGRANETTPAEQAEFEAKSRMKKQTDKGYRKTKKELEDLPILPMLAYEYEKKKHLLEYPCFASRKLDGLRCLALKTAEGVELRSRGGQTYTVKHIQEELNDVMFEGEIWDGEIYLHGLHLQEISSAVTKPKGNPNSPNLEYHIFDLPIAAQGSLKDYRLTSLDDDFAERQTNLLNLEDAIHESPHLYVVETLIVDDEDDIFEYHREFVSQGYEGTMLRNAIGVYESGKRSSDLMKYKEFMDAEFKIRRVKKDRNGNAVFTVENIFAENEFDVVFGDHKFRKEVLENPEKWVDGYLTVKYQTLYKDTRIPQFPTGKAIRIPEDMG